MRTKKLKESSAKKFLHTTPMGGFLFCPSLHARDVSMSPNTGKMITILSRANNGGSPSDVGNILVCRHPNDGIQRCDMRA